MATVRFRGAKESGGSFEPCPQGPQQLTCCDVIDLGLVSSTYLGKTKQVQKVRVVWQSENLRDDGQRHLIRSSYTNSLHEKARLRPVIEAHLGRDMTDQEADEGFDDTMVLGTTIFASIKHRAYEVGGQKRVACDVTSPMALPKGMLAIRPEGYVRSKWDEPGAHDRDQPNVDPDEGRQGPLDDADADSHGRQEDDSDIPF